MLRSQIKSQIHRALEERRGRMLRWRWSSSRRRGDGSSHCRWINVFTLTKQHSFNSHCEGPTGVWQSPGQVWTRRTAGKKREARERGGSWRRSGIGSWGGYFLFGREKLQQVSVANEEDGTKTHTHTTQHSTGRDAKPANTDVQKWYASSFTENYI